MNHLSALLRETNKDRRQRAYRLLGRLRLRGYPQAHTWPSIASLLRLAWSTRLSDVPDRSVMRAVQGGAPRFVVRSSGW